MLAILGFDKCVQSLQVVVKVSSSLNSVRIAIISKHSEKPTSRPSSISRSSSSSLETLAVTSRIIFFNVAFSVVASDDRRPTNLLDVVCCSVSDSCWKRRSWDAMLGPVMMNAEGILSPLYEARIRGCAYTYIRGGWVLTNLSQLL